MQINDQSRHTLFNAIPCGTVGFDTELVLGGLNVVSSRWVDWKSFTLNHTARHFSPKLVLPHGEVAHCHGYIMGTLWDDSLEEKWTGIRVFVVDAELRVEGSDKSYNFMFSLDSFTNANARSGKLSYVVRFLRLCN